MKIFDIAIIGAGPAGMMAGIIAGRNGAEVILIEKNDSLGRKLLATGNGRCNITNQNIDVSHYHGSDPDFVLPIFKEFSQKDTVAFFESLGVKLKEEDRGRLFPNTDQAGTVLASLVKELSTNNVTIKMNSCVKDINFSDCWHVVLANKETIKARKVILTTGGRAAYHLGSSGDGLFWSQNLKHTIAPIYAALVPIETVEKWPERIQGIKTKVKAQAYHQNKLVAENRGDLLFTHYGLSGPAVMGLAGGIADLLDCSGASVELKVDLLPDFSENELIEKINFLFEKNGAKSILNNLSELLPQNLVKQTLAVTKVDLTKKSAETSRTERASICRHLKEFSAKVSKLRSLKEAQVTRGGINTNEVNNQTLESLIATDLYFAGEILDIYADSGGYNLQWSWSSGYVSGLSASKTKV
ncbi:MAG: NAD(P)/FAD-dependent oxidoreductase [bacterium]